MRTIKPARRAWTVVSTSNWPRRNRAPSSPDRALLLAGRAPRRRAFLLGAATGILYGVTSAITDRTGYLLNSGVLHALTT